MSDDNDEKYTDPERRRKQKDDTTERDLPKKVWDRLSQKERKKAMRAKEKASEQGQQHVACTPVVQEAVEDIREEHHEPTKQELYDEAMKLAKGVVQ